MMFPSSFGVDDVIRAGVEGSLRQQLSDFVTLGAATSENLKAAPRLSVPHDGFKHPL